MAKIKSKWVCQECNYETASYLGRCPECNSWGSLQEELITKESSGKSGLIENFDSYIEPQLLDNIEITEEIRFSTGYVDFDRVLGKGIVQNSLILVGGDPGIGKSTLLLQMSGKLSEVGSKVLYISAEESPKQIKLRAQRVNLDTYNIFVFAQTNINLIIDEAKKLQPDVIIVDSIQAIYNPNLTSSAGSISQLKECCSKLLDLAKYSNMAVFLIGHVTKEGIIAGPKTLEHMVDTVLYLEGDNYKSYRILRTVKNRFGSINEMGVFSMNDSGLEEVLNPSEYFLSQRSDATAPGSVVISLMEGTRPLLVEVQALVGMTSYPSPRRVATGINYNRLLQIMAVLEKRIGLNLSQFDVYASLVGGITIDEPSADLGIALAIVSSMRNVIVDKNTVAMGEIGLTGEIRSINNLDLRINEAIKQGFKRVIVPQVNLDLKESKYDIELIPVNRLIEVISCGVLSSG